MRMIDNQLKARGGMVWLQFWAPVTSLGHRQRKDKLALVLLINCDKTFESFFSGCVFEKPGPTFFCSKVICIAVVSHQFLEHASVQISRPLAI